MEMTPQEQHIIDAIFVSLKKIESIEISDTMLERFPNRPEIVEMAKRMKWLAGVLQSCSMSGIPVPALNELSHHLTGVVGDLGDLKQYSKYGNENDYASELTRSLNQLWLYGMPCIAHSQISGGENSAAEILSRLTKLETTMQERIGIATKKMEDSVGLVEAMYKKGVIAQHAGSFKVESERQFSASIKWAFAAGVSAVVLVVYSEWQHRQVHQFLTSPAGNHLSSAVAIDIVASRLIIVSMLTYLLVICVRNFSSCRHNVIVNRHRMNALSSFENFAAAADDKEARSAVLLEATKAVFSPQPTGLLKNEAEPSHGAQIIEIIKSAKSH